MYQPHGTCPTVLSTAAVIIVSRLPLLLHGTLDRCWLGLNSNSRKLGFYGIVNNKEGAASAPEKIAETPILWVWQDNNDTTTFTLIRQTELLYEQDSLVCPTKNQSMATLDDLDEIVPHHTHHRPWR